MGNLYICSPAALIPTKRDFFINKFLHRQSFHFSSSFRVFCLDKFPHRWRFHRRSSFLLLFITEGVSFAVLPCAYSSLTNSSTEGVSTAEVSSFCCSPSQHYSTKGVSTTVTPSSSSALTNSATEGISTAEVPLFCSSLPAHLFASWFSAVFVSFDFIFSLFQRRELAVHYSLQSTRSLMNAFFPLASLVLGVCFRLLRFTMSANVTGSFFSEEAKSGRK